MEAVAHAQRRRRRAAATVLAAIVLLSTCGEREDSGGPPPGVTDARPAGTPASDDTATTVTSSPPSTSTTSVSSTAPATVPGEVPSSSEVSTTTVGPVSTGVPIPVDRLPIPVAGEALRERDCYSIDTGNLAWPVSCEELHDGQIVGTGTPLPAIDPYEPSGDVWRYVFVAACGDAFEEFTGVELDDAGERFAPGAILTSPPGAAVDVSCTAVGSDGQQWAGTAEQVVGAYSGIDRGECFDFPTPDSGAEEIACDLPHEAEMFVVDSPVGIEAVTAPYPTHDEWAEIAHSICDDPFGAYTGRSLWDAELSYVYIYTLESDWDVVVLRRLSCAVVAADGTHLVGSVQA